MSVRKTETRLPAGLQPADLGEAVTSADGRCVLISFITAPLAVERANAYVVFVTDAGLAGATQSFEWTFTENDEPPTATCQESDKYTAPMKPTPFFPAWQARFAPMGSRLAGTLQSLRAATLA